MRFAGCRDMLRQMAEYGVPMKVQVGRRSTERLDGLSIALETAGAFACAIQAHPRTEEWEMRKVALVAAMLMAFGFGGAAAFAATADKPPTPPGQPNCEHGNSGAECKEDPQPDHGGECQEHGKLGGQNEDHCLDGTTPTETTTSETTQEKTTHTEPTPARQTQKTET